MTPIMIGIYATFCALLAIVGRHTRVGVMGIFLLSVIFTPLLVGLILALSRPLPKLKAPMSANGR